MKAYSWLPAISFLVRNGCWKQHVKNNINYVFKLLIPFQTEQLNEVAPPIACFDKIANACKVPDNFPLVSCSYKYSSATDNCSNQVQLERYLLSSWLHRQWLGCVHILRIAEKIVTAEITSHGRSARVNLKCNTSAIWLIWKICLLVQVTDWYKAN